MTVCFTLVSLSALVHLMSVQPTRTVCSYVSLENPFFLPGFLTDDYYIFWMDGLRISMQRLVSDAPCYALFIVIRWFVTDSFLYPLAAIFHMAWFTMPLHARLVDEWLLRGIILAHIPRPRVQRSALKGLTAFIQIIGSFI